jgi:hypothetical protein
MELDRAMALLPFVEEQESRAALLLLVPSGRLPKVAHGELLRVSDGPLSFELSGSCAYQSTFEYSSDTPGRSRA